MSEATADKETIAILGGTGDLGTGLAIRWSKAGYKIVIGSRTLEKAQTAVANLQAISPETPAEAMENGDAAIEKLPPVATSGKSTQWKAGTLAG